MSISKQEHLQLIRAKCVELLELAKRRTPGRWHAANRCKTPIQCGEKHIAMVNYYKSGNPETNVFGDEHEANAAFIASAAGPFEAALVSTVVAIDACTADEPMYQETYFLANAQLVKRIIDAWPLELLQSKNT